MNLTQEERSILRGKRGAGAAKAMEILCALGAVYGARSMVRVDCVQVSGVSYDNIGEHGLAFLEDWAAQGSRAVVPAAMNPGGADRKLWRILGFSREFVRKQERVIAALERLGIRPTLTCTPYHIGFAPGFGRHAAWAESSAVCFANSVLGARTNREGGPSAIAAALTGRTPRHALHTDAGRRPTRVIDVRCSVDSCADAGALGVMIGGLVSSDQGGGIPYIAGIAPPHGPQSIAWLKALGAGMAAAGSVAMFHLEGVTPEAAFARRGLGAVASRKIVIRSIARGHRTLSSGKGRIDLVALGCPHASLEDLARIAGLLRSRKAKVPLWIFVAEGIRGQAQACGMARALERSGAKLVSDTCMVVAPLKALGIRTLATDSAKAAFYLPSHHGARVYFGSLEQNVESAVTGAWIPSESAP